MKNKGTVAVGVIIFTVIIIIMIVVSLLGASALGAGLPEATDTSQPLLATFTPDACASENIAATIAGLEKLSREFEDTYNIAALTPSTQLTPLITDLQRVRREAEDYVVPACMGTLKQYQIASMNAYIEALKALIGALQVNVQPSPGMTQEQYDLAVQQELAKYYVLANQRIAEASSLTDKYIVEKARLLGVTLVPTTTAAAPAEMTATPTP